MCRKFENMVDFKQLPFVSQVVVASKCLSVYDKREYIYGDKSYSQ